MGASQRGAHDQSEDAYAVEKKLHQIYSFNNIPGNFSYDWSVICIEDAFWNHPRK